MKIDFEKASFKDFENPVGMDAYERAAYFNEFLYFLEGRGHFNYRLLGFTGCRPVVDQKEKKDPSPDQLTLDFK